MLIEITPELSIDSAELEESFVRASGPGGQHVNKTSTAVQLRFDIRGSRSLSNAVAIRAMKLAGSRLTQDGVIIIASQGHRSLKRNREEALERLLDLLRAATVRPEIRRATRVPRGAKERRLESKGHRSSLKSSRRDTGAQD